MTVQTIVQKVLEKLKDGLPQAQVVEGFQPEGAGRLPLKPVVAVSPVWGRKQPGGWAARVQVAAFLPRGSSAQSGAALLEKAAGLLEGAFQMITQTEQKGFEPDRATGLLRGVLLLDCEGTEPEGPVAVAVGDKALEAAGWSLKAEQTGRALTAIGEDAPFWDRGPTAYTVELIGLDVAGLGGLHGFTLAVGGWLFKGCRWKSLEPQKGRAAAVSFWGEVTG